MKQIIIDDELTTYFIDEEGRLLNKKTNNYLKGAISGGYKAYSLRWKNKRYQKLAHRLVAEYFIPNPNNFPIVNHIDGNKLNNRVENLEWTTVSQNNQHAYDTGLKEKTNGVYERVQYTEDLEGEIWKYYKDTHFLISNKGRARNNVTNNILKGKITKDGYLEWCFSIQGKKKSFLAHRLIYETFIGELEEDKVINHIDGNKLNNRVENLELVTSSYNSLHSYYIIKTNSSAKTVGKYSLQGELLEVYPSCAEAARQNEGCLSNLIVNVCNGKKNSHHGYIWKYI